MDLRSSSALREPRRDRMIPVQNLQTKMVRIPRPGPAFRVVLLTGPTEGKPHFSRSHSTQANMAVRYGEAESHPGASSVPPAQTVKPRHDVDGRRPTPTTIALQQMSYNRRQSEARRVSVSNIGPMADPMGPVDRDGRRSFLQTLSEWNQQRRLDHLRHVV